MLLILLVILAAGWALTIVWSVLRIRGLRETSEILAEGQSEFAQRAIDAERDMAVARTESEYVKATLVSVLQRPAVALLTEENIQQLGAIIQSFVKPGMEN